MGEVKLIIYDENHIDQQTNLHDVLIAAFELYQDKIFIIDENSNNNGDEFNIISLQSKGFCANISTHYSIIINFIGKDDLGGKCLIDILKKIRNVGASFDIGYIFDLGLIYDMDLNPETEMGILNKYMILKAGPRRITEKCF